MPDPVFKSTEGYTPKSAKNYVNPDEIDTASPEFMEADTDEFDTEPALDQDEIDTDTPNLEAEEDTREYPAVSEDQPLTPDTIKVPAPQKQAGGCLKTFGLITGVIAFSVLAVIAVIIYFLLFYQPADTSF